MLMISSRVLALPYCTGSYERVFFQAEVFSCTAGVDSYTLGLLGQKAERGCRAVDQQLFGPEDADHGCLKRQSTGAQAYVPK